MGDLREVYAGGRNGVILHGLARCALVFLKNRAAHLHAAAEKSVRARLKGWG